MEENPQRTSNANTGVAQCSRKSRGQNAPSPSPPSPSSKRCGKNCRSWAAAVIADCVALCCCPCAVVNFLTFALVKAPWKIGRKLLGGRRKKRKTPRKRGKNASEREDGEGDFGFVVEVDGSLSEGLDTTSFGVEDEARISARVEAERVWLELYQIGHLGFGRVSFTGIQ